MSMVEPGTNIGKTTSVMEEMNAGFVSRIGTIKKIVTKAVIEIIRPEMAYDSTAC